MLNSLQSTLQANIAGGHMHMVAWMDCNDAELSTLACQNETQMTYSFVTAKSALSRSGFRGSACRLDAGFRGKSLEVARWYGEYLDEDGEWERGTGDI